MMFAQSITAAEPRLNALRDQLKAHFEKVDDSNVSDEQLQISTDLNAKIKQEERGLDALRDAERNLGEQSDDSGARTVVVARGTQLQQRAEPLRPFNVQRKKIEPQELLVRAGTVQLLAHLQRKAVAQVMQEVYGDDEATRAVLDWATRAASAPAMTTVTGWAAEPVQQLNIGFMDTLMP